MTSTLIAVMSIFTVPLIPLLPLTAKYLNRWKSIEDTTEGTGLEDVSIVLVQ